MTEVEDDESSGHPAQRSSKQRQPRTAAKRDTRDDEAVKAEFDRMRQSKGYSEILASRRRLPAFTARDQFLNMLEKNRCVVVVGETGNIFTPHLHKLSSDIPHRLWQNDAM